MPPYITAEEMRATEDTVISIHCIFYFIYMLHFEKKRNYTFSVDAQSLVDREFNLSRERVRIVNDFDSFVG